ncbi:hypothetical protein [Streptomyces sp. NPDC005548]|uniref:hypothetical protein n=1 Tax=Streptomyces sp. NPDC005548 TaxID=3364724 RepID=UPI00369E23B3
MTTTDAPPAPAAAEPETSAAPPAPEPAAEQPDAETDSTDEPKEKRHRRGGVPIEPLVIGAGNGTALAATAAYQAGGPIGLAAAAGTAVALAAGGALQRRRTVRSRTSTAAGRTRGGSGSSNRGRTRGGSTRGGSGRGSSGRGGAHRRGGALGAGSRGRGDTTPHTRRGALGSLGALTSRGGRGAGRLNSPRFDDPRRKKRRRKDDHRDKAPSTRTRTPRKRSRLGWVRPAASAARRGMASTGRGIARVARPIGAAARTAWNKARPVLRAAARRAARATRAVWDGARSGLVGVAAALWQRNWRVFRPAVRAMWRRIQTKRAAKRAATGPIMTGPGVASTPPPVADYVRRPTTVGGSSSTLGGSMPGGHHFLAGAMELERVAATYKPDGMMQVGRDFAGLPQALEHVANAMKITTARADAEQPLDPRITEIMKQIYTLQMKAAELSRELRPAFRSCHGIEIDRLQNQRRNEHEWDVRANADTSL